jgi:PAS domain-containing protein
MIDRSELMEAALASFPEGLALLGRSGEVAFWNEAAESITGYPSMETVCRQIPWALEPLLLECNLDAAEEPRLRAQFARYVLIHTQSRSGDDLPLMMRSVLLRRSGRARGNGGGLSSCRGG